MKIGILGGTFDPIHRGHTYIARRIRKIFDLDRILLMVSNLPPHKEKREVSNPFHRYAMVVLGIGKVAGVYASLWELQKPGASYTIDTLAHLSTIHPQNKYCFIAGSDALKEIHLWKEYNKLLNEYSFIFIQRPGSEVDLRNLTINAGLKSKIKRVAKGAKSRIQAGQSFLVRLNAPPISSTSIREMIADGQWPSPRFVSPAVLEYVKKYRLYEPNQKSTDKSLPGH